MKDHIQRQALIRFCFSIFMKTLVTSNEKRIQSTFIKCAFVPNVTENGKQYLVTQEWRKAINNDYSLNAQKRTTWTWHHTKGSIT